MIFIFVLLGSACAQDGLRFTRYSGYFWNDVNWFNTATSTHSGVVKSIADIHTGTGGVQSVNGADYYSVQWLGFFRATVSGTWWFYTNSDDASYLWLSSNALSPSTSNALVNNGGEHPMQERSGSVSLTANAYYPLRIQFGEAGGGDNCVVYWTPPGGAQTTDGTNYFTLCPPGSTCSSLTEHACPTGTIKKIYRARALV